MKKLFKLISIWLLPIVFIILVIFAIRVFSADFRFGHQSSMIYQNPFPWAKYFVTVSINKFIAKTKCPELLIGRNSVAAWIMPNKILSIYVI